MSLTTALTGISGILATPFDDAGEIAPERRFFFGFDGTDIRLLQQSVRFFRRQRGGLQGKC